MSKGIHSLKDVSPFDLYTLDGKDVWEVVSTCALPTIQLRNLRTSEQVSAAVGSPAVAEFVRLVPQQEH